MLFKSKAYALLSCALFVSGTPSIAAELGYYSSPTVAQNMLVFESEGDLWRASTNGGPATRLTTHVELETNPALSPDGQTLAFNARYDGATEVYIMPVSGGKPTQLTFEGGGTGVRGWTPDGRIVFASTNEPTLRARVLRTVDPVSKSFTTLPLDRANQASYADDGNSLFFTRYGLGGDNAVLYRGGMMSQLWRHTPRSQSEPIRLAPDFNAPIRSPMYENGRIYFTSDKSGADNIWSLNADGADAQQHTNFSGWQIKTPDLSNGKIYYQRGADLFTYDIAGNTETRLNLNLISDRDYTRQRWLGDPLSYTESANISANGKSATVTARGNVVIGFPGKRRRVELAIPQESRARNATAGNGGKWVYAIIDQDNIGEIWRFPADGRGDAEKMTRGSDAHIWNFSLSPDNEHMVYQDKKARLWSLNIVSKSKTLLETNTSGDDEAFYDINWSAGGRYLAHAASDERGVNRVILRDFETGIRKIVTGGKYYSFSPTFSADGNWLYFISDRNFRATPPGPWGDRNLGPQFANRGKIYALQLLPDAEFPFKTEDEIASEADAKDDTDKDEAKDQEDDDKNKSNAKDPTIVFEGVENRIWIVPVKPGKYSDLHASGKFLYALSGSNDGDKLISIGINPLDPKVSTFASKVLTYSLSADGEKLFFAAGDRSAPNMAIVPADAKAPDDLSDHKLRMGDWKLGINPKAEWRQMLLDAWRLHRDFAFDADLRGVDWNAVRTQYLPLTARLGHRSELNDLLGQMTANLGILHSQIGFGDQPKDAENGNAASLGATFKRVGAGLAFDTIYTGERDLIEQLGPLLKPGVDVRAGDILKAVDGQTITDKADLVRALQHKTGQQVRLDYTRGSETKSVIIKPIAYNAERRLRYRHWVQSNREAVAAASNGNIGYLHIRAMGGNDIASFARDFYEHVHKDGIIIDVRGNNGGNIDSWLISALLRQVWAFWESPLGGTPQTNMQQTFRGHLTVLIDQNTYSDGETFAAAVKALDIAPLIGTRTAGAGIWLSDRNRLADRGIARVAEFAQFGLDGRWLLEGHGVSPDIEVSNPPRASFNGQDAQLDAALKYLRDKIQEEPIPELKAQPLPALGTTGQDVK